MLHQGLRDLHLLRPIYNGYMKVSVIATSYKHVPKLTLRAGASALLLSVELNFDPLDRAKLHFISQTSISSLVASTFSSVFTCACTPRKSRLSS